MIAIDLRSVVFSLYFPLLFIIRYLSKYYSFLHLLFICLLVFFVLVLLPAMIDKIIFKQKAEKFLRKKLRFLSPADSYRLKKSLENDIHSNYDDFVNKKK